MPQDNVAATLFCIEFITMKLKVLFLFIFITLLISSVQAQILGFGSKDDEIIDEKVTYEAKNDAVHFVKIIENLPLTAGEIYEYSLEFLEEAYKITKYDITQQNSAKKFIVGEGEFSSFERYGNLISQYTFNCKHSFRVDAKPGRARICIIVKEYNVNKEKTNGRETITKSLLDVAPINTANYVNDDMYIKAFGTLKQMAIKSIHAIEESLKNKQSSDAGSW